MKKNLFYAGMLLLGMMVATGCSNEETLEQVASNGKTIQAVIEKATEARTSVSDNYEVLWTTGDQFDVWSETGKVGTLELKSGEGTTSASFGLPAGADEFGVEEGMTAFFPSNEAGEKTYTFETSYTSQETDAPMLGTFTNGKFTFQLLTAMVRVVVTDVPQGTAVLTISSESVNFTGEASLSNGVLGLSNDGGKEVTVTISNNTESTLTFDVPVPALQYTGGLNVKLTVGNTEEFNKKTNEFTAEVGKIYVFGAKTVSVDDADDLTSTIQDLLEGGYSVVLEGEAEEVAVSGLSVPENITASLDLNGKTLNLGETTDLMAKAADLKNGITNNGTLTITNGKITASEDYYAAIYNNGTLNITDSEIEAVNRGVVNCGKATLDCDITSTNSNAVCGYGVDNEITIEGGTYTASETIAEASALRMDAYKNNDTSQGQVDSAWKLTINGGTFVSEKWVALVMLNNYAGLGENAGWAKINGGTFTGSEDYADIYGAAIENITISSSCVLTNEIIKNSSKNPNSYSCEMNNYNIQDSENHYDDVMNNNN